MKANSYFLNTLITPNCIIVIALYNLSDRAIISIITTNLYRNGSMLRSLAKRLSLQFSKSCHVTWVLSLALFLSVLNFPSTVWATGS